MKQKWICILFFFAIFTIFGCQSNQKTEDSAPLPDIDPAFLRENGSLSLTANGLTVVLDEKTGLLKEFSSPLSSLKAERIIADIGINGAFLFEQLGYRDLSSLATYELPLLWLKRKALPEYSINSIKQTERGFEVSISQGEFTILYQYRFLENALALSISCSTTSPEKIPVGGVAFLVHGVDGYESANSTFEFPGSTPDGQIPFSSRGIYRAVCADYCAPAIQFSDAGHASNFLFVNEVEKWTAGCYYDENNRPGAAFLSATEGYISQASPMEIGTLYLPLSMPGKDAYLCISDFWASLGFHVPENSAANDFAALYSGHPYGTMDTGYFNKLTLQEYAGELPAISKMGFSGIWLLPIFQHTGSNVYEPIDQGIIDKRYGGEEGGAAFIRAAHEENLKVLFDFVPHGPRPVYPFAKEHEDWISKDKDGNAQIEWECVSMDYNHPEYYKYTADLAAFYAGEFGLDGARIDCSMGGLPNWSSATGLRASAAGLFAGIHIVKAMKEGFATGGKTSLLLPENFHPSPAYAQYTDIFYDMPLYRCLYNLRTSNVSETEYVSRLTHFLDIEQKTSVKGQKKLRFLGNHDTVTWTFDAKRAQALYGVEKAKALWMAIGWIDGVLYLYQGDENPAAYGLFGENLTDFFTELIAAKKTYLPMDYQITYLSTGTPVFAFYRYSPDRKETRLVLVNISEKENSFPLPMPDTAVLTSIGAYSMKENSETGYGEVILSPYSGIILEVGK